MSGSGQRCAEHNGADAGWRCNGCRKYLCGECTSQLVNLFFCAHCDAQATQMSEQRDEKPLLTWVVDSLVYPFKTAPVTLVVIAAIVGLSFLHGKVFGTGAAQVVVLALAGLLTVAAAARRDTHGAFKIVWKTAATTALLWVPIAVYVVLGKRALNDEFGGLVGGLAAVYAPLVVAMSATDAPFVNALNPFAVFDSLWLAKRRYAAFLFWTFGFAALAVKLSLKPLAISAEPAVNAGVTTGLAIVCMLAACRMLGTFAWVHGYIFGWGTRETYVDPLVADRARAGRKGNYGVGEDGTSAPSAPTEADAARADAREIRRLLSKDKLSEALALYQKRTNWEEDAFNAKGLLDLGMAAAKAKDDDLAVTLLTRVSQSGTPFAPRAMFRLARVYEGGGTPDRAVALYEEILADYAQSDVARPAKERLAELRGEHA